MHNEALRNVYFCSDIIIMFETWKRDCVGHVEHKEKYNRNMHRICWHKR
jgi:hypothetical protein